MGCEVLRSACLSVCLFARISQNPNCTNFSVHVTHGGGWLGSIRSDGNAMRYLCPVLWMTSCFHIMGWGRIKHEVMFRRVRQVVTPGRSLLSTIAFLFQQFRSASALTSAESCCLFLLLVNVRRNKERLSDGALK